MHSAGESSSTDIRDQLRKDHQVALAELEALRREGDERRSHELLARLRRSWMIDTLSKESVPDVLVTRSEIRSGTVRQSAFGKQGCRVVIRD